MFEVPANKLRGIRVLDKDLVIRAKQNQRKLPAKQLASFVGKAMALRLAIGPVKYYLRSLYDSLGEWTAQPNRPVKLSRQALRDLDWWKGLDSREESPIWRPLAELNLHTNASLSAAYAGWGAVINWRRQVTT